MWRPTTQRDIYKTISLIKAKDPRIYEKDVKFFEGMYRLHGEAWGEGLVGINTRVRNAILV